MLLLVGKKEYKQRNNTQREDRNKFRKSLLLLYGFVWRNNLRQFLKYCECIIFVLDKTWELRYL